MQNLVWFPGQTVIYVPVENPEEDEEEGDVEEELPDEVAVSYTTLQVGENLRTCNHIQGQDTSQKKDKYRREDKGHRCCFWGGGGAEFTQVLAALAIFPRIIVKNRMK